MILLSIICLRFLGFKSNIILRYMLNEGLMIPYYINIWKCIIEGWMMIWINTNFIGFLNKRRINNVNVNNIFCNGINGINSGINSGVN